MIEHCLMIELIRNRPEGIQMTNDVHFGKSDLICSQKVNCNGIRFTVQIKSLKFHIMRALDGVITRSDG